MIIEYVGNLNLPPWNSRYSASVILNILHIW